MICYVPKRICIYKYIYTDTYIPWAPQTYMFRGSFWYITWFLGGQNLYFLWFWGSWYMSTPGCWSQAKIHSLQILSLAASKDFWSATRSQLNHKEDPPLLYIYTWGTEFITVLIGIVVPFITGWGPPCTEKSKWTTRKTRPYFPWNTGCFMTGSLFHGLL